ncbi:MAG: type II secretion system secretin GspD [Acidobacteria bacterium]|nr:type II secretion system secretin GspD [Acidobacteriota bacterium]
MRAGLILLAAASLLTTEAFAQQPTAPAAPPIVLNLPNASLAEVIDILARQLKINYILDPRVKGSITVHTYGEVKSTEVKGLLETILRVNGYSMVQVGEIYRIVPATEAIKLPVSPRTAEGKDIPNDELLVLNLVFLKFASAAEIAKLVEQFLGEGAKAIVYEPANLLLVLDNGRNMRRTMDLVSLFDSETLAGQRIRLYEMKHTRPVELARELDRVVSTLGLAQKNASVQFLPVERINMLVAFAPNPAAFPEIEKWIDRLDVEAKPPVGGTDNYVFRVKYGRAESLAMAVTLLYLSQNLNPSDTFTYLWLMQAMSSLQTTQSGQGGTGQNQNGVGGGGMGMMGGMGGMGMMGMGGMGMMGMGGMGMMGGMGGYGNPYMQGGYGMQPGYGVQGGQAGIGAAGAAGRSGDATGTYMGGGYGQGMGMGGMAQMKIPRVIPNPFDNSLLIQATPQEFQQIDKLLKQIDVPPRQVLIEAKIYEVTLSDAFSSGVQAYLQRAGTMTTRNLLGQATGTGVQLSAGWLVSQSRELATFLQTQEDVRRTKVIAAPSVIATDNIPASINVGTEVPILTSQLATGVQQGGTSQFANTVQNRNAGVTLALTARVQPSGIVTLIINQEVSSVIAPAASASIQSPSFAKRTVQTQVTVQDGDTVAIGGIIQENDVNSTSGIPGLIKIPFIGGLFGSKSITKTRTELVIFLTPRVIYDTNAITEATEEIKGQFKRLNRIYNKN